MSVVIVALSMGVGHARGWDASQWSAYGTWFTGFATFAAVVVALWQANQARAQANELYRRQTHSAALAVQRSELMLLWPVLDKAHLAALEYPTSFRLSESEARATERSEWLRMLTELRLALIPPGVSGELMV
ncbi:hypothetical protein [Rhodococcus sp. 2G]|uniref:hypothetical protein n=1 Tax=Rhodococcus sp. 2G TaxID=1570939 RepID=UPI000A87E8D0|nr:hypothetical protein [Rhodococcus sp. 2G]